VFVTDIAQACASLAVLAPGAGESYNVCTGRATRLDELASVLVAATGKRVEVVFTGDQGPGHVRNWVGSAGRLNALGISCPTTIAEGASKVVDWLSKDAGPAHRP
jgi:nucleoside-diphosphate-sugar epimerase